MLVVGSFQKMKQIPCLILFIFLFNISCTKNELIIPNNHRFEKIGIKNSTLIHEIEYDKFNRPLLIKGDALGSTYPPETNIIYKKGVIQQLISKSTQNTNFEVINKVSYLDNNTIQLESTLTNIIYTNIFEFNNELITKITRLRSSLQNSKIIETYSYNSQNNLIKIEVYHNETLLNTIEYGEYDEKINPFYSNSKVWTIINGVHNVTLAPNNQIPISKNNPRLFKRTTYLSNGLKYLTTINSTLSYNVNDLLVNVKGNPTNETYDNGKLISSSIFEHNGESEIIYQK